MRPLILTLRLGDAAARYFNSLREQHYPSALNVVPAHVTLFHQLPGEEENAVAAELSALSQAIAAPPLRVSGLRFLGRGVAFRLESPAVADIRRTLARAWDRWLTPQDRQPFQPHLTIQNKVHREVARELHAELQSQFQPWDTTASGIDLWHYCNGPWQHRLFFPFQGSERAL